MINLSSSALKIRVILPPVDMRKSFDGLTGVLREFSIANLNAQFLYAFSNKRRNRVKLLYFDRTGIYVVAKKLEEGTFSWPPAGKKDEQVLPLAPESLQLLLAGVILLTYAIKLYPERHLSIIIHLYYQLAISEKL